MRGCGMPRAVRRAGSGVMVGLLSVLITIAGPSMVLGPATAQVPPVIQGAGLFTFPGDWSTIPEKTVTLFFPGQASWEFLTSSDHPGSEQVVAGTTCQACHAGQEKMKGESLVKHARLEADPIAGKAGSLDVPVRAAFGDQYIYM